MGARIAVTIAKPHEEYILQSGDFRQIAQKIIDQLGKEDAKRVAKYLCSELHCGDKD